MNISIMYTPQNNVLKFAAEELEYYLQKMNPQITLSHNTQKSDFQIGLSPTLMVPEQKSPELDDCYHIEVQSLHGIIEGSNPRSVLLGVYHFLYKLGCRFLGPGRDYETIPSYNGIENMSVSSNQNADLRHRGVCIEGADSLENIINFIDWLPKLGYNSFFVQFKMPFSFMNNWYDHKNNPLVEMESLTDITAVEYSNQIDEAMNKRGLLHHRVGHGWTSEVLGTSATGWEKETGGLDKETKEFVAEINGNRDFHTGIPTNTNLCYSNPKVVEAFTNSVVTYAKEHKDVNFLHIWLADDHNNHCECVSCMNELPTDLYINILNKIDEALTASNLSTKIVFLLYQELLWPSAKETLKNPERFLLMFAPISRTFDHSYKERSETAPIPNFVKNHIVLPNGLEENLAFLKEWQKIFAGDSFDYDYPLGRAHYGDMGYVSISRIIYEDIHQLKALGLNGYMSCQELRSFLPNGLPNYVMGMCLFDNTLSFDEIAADYYKHAYGEGWKEIFHYLDTISSLCSCDYFNRIGERVNPKITENMEALITCVINFHPTLSKYFGLAQDVEYRFLKNLDYHSQYSILLAEALYHLSDGDQEKANSKWDSFTHFIRSNEKEYQECLDVYRIIEVATNYAGFKKDPL